MRKTLLVLTCLIFSNLALAQTPTTDSVRAKLLQMESTLRSNSSSFSANEILQIDSLVERAREAINVHGTNDEYVRCRQAGFTHESCQGQTSAYVSCRRAGFTHESCNGQSEDYVVC